MSSMWNDISEESMRKLERIAENEMLTQEEIRENLDVQRKARSVSRSRTANMRWSMIRICREQFAEMK